MHARQPRRKSSRRQCGTDWWHWRGHTRSHALTLPVTSEGGRRIEPSTTLHALIQTILSPYEDQTDGDRARVTTSGPDIQLAGGLVTTFALLLHEFATNAAKYGALSTPAGHIDIACSENDGQFALSWQERGGPRIDSHADSEGFGTCSPAQL